MVELTGEKQNDKRPFDFFAMPTVFSKVSQEDLQPEASTIYDTPCQHNSDEPEQPKKAEAAYHPSLSAEHENIFVPFSDKVQGVQLYNGQMQLEVYNWKSQFPRFILGNNLPGSPKGGLDIIFDEDMIKMEFQIPRGFPDGMIGFMTILQYIFCEPEKLGIIQMEIGRGPIKSETRRGKRDVHVKWNSPRENFGCRVNWMKENDDSIIKFKFSNMIKMGIDEEMIVTVDESHEFFRQISSADPSIYGQWLAMPVRIWLRTQWVMRQAGEMNNDIFNKLSTIPTTSTTIGVTKNKKKKKSKHQKLSGAKPESITALGQLNTAEELVEPQAIGKSMPSLTIDTGKSNTEWKNKCTSVAAGIEDKHQTGHVKLTSLRGHSQEAHRDITRHSVPTEPQLAAVADQSTVCTSLSSSIPIVLGSLTTSSFETARTHLTSSPSLPSTTSSHFFTPIDSPLEKERGEVEETNAGQAEPGEVPINLPLTPLEEESEAEFVWPVSGAELYESDPELYADYRKEVLEVEIPRLESPAAVRLGLFEGLQRITVSTPTDPPSRTPMLEQRTTDDAELATDNDSDRPVKPLDKAPAKSSRILALKVVKRSTHAREERALTASEENTSQTPLSPESPRHGWEGPTSSSPETLEGKLTPTAIQSGGNVDSSMVAHWDLSRTSLPCAKMGCLSLCSSMDESSVVCPGCGPFSLVRYCGKEHLWEDAKGHWIYCGTYGFVHPCIISSIPKDVLVGPPMLPNLHRWEQPARYRQAMRFTSARDLGDYFVFQEVAHPMGIWGAPESHGWPGCSSQTALTLRFAKPEEKDRFRRVLAVCLFMAPEHPALVGYLYRLIRDWVRSHYEWLSDRNMDRMLANQLSLETGVVPDFFIESEYAGPRHACETEWSGDPNPCSDPTCACDRRPMSLNYPAMSGFQELCDDLEGRFWLLRAHRTTHPVVRDVVDRIRGEGFEQARLVGRVYPRGEGWDGAGTGPMWIEDWEATGRQGAPPP